MMFVHMLSDSDVHDLLDDLRHKAEPEMVEAIKRTSDAIFSLGGVIRSMENVGARQLPYKMFKHGKRFENGHYFLIHFDGKPTALRSLHDQLRLDTDIIRPKALRAEVVDSKPCLHRQCDFGELTQESRTQLFRDLREFVRKL